eukprot:1154680-Pelagomonas_calceolata.AAC.2
MSPSFRGEFFRVILWEVQVLGSVMDSGIRDNRLGMQDYGGTQEPSVESSFLPMTSQPGPTYTGLGPSSLGEPLLETETPYLPMANPQKLDTGTNVLQQA